MSKQISFEELVENEARKSSNKLYSRNVSKLSNLPLPKDSALEIHINQLLLNNPQIRETAKARVLASKDAYSESLRAIGLPGSEPLLATEIDI